MIPTTPFSDLSDKAQAMYRQGVKDFHKQVKIPAGSTALLAAATEIAEAGHGRLYITEKYDSTLTVAARAKGFSVARRDTATDGNYAQTLLYVEVELLKNAHDQSGLLLACQYGARVATRGVTGSPWPVWNTEVRHATAKDSDHSGSILSTLTIDHPVLDSVDGFSTTMVGILSDLRMWPTDTDVTLLDMHDGDPIDEPEFCTFGSCEANPHPWGPYLPAERDDLNAYKGRPVRITTTPLALVSENGLHIARTAVTHADY